MNNHNSDPKDTAIRRALSAFVDEMPVAGKSEGWEQIERTLYARTKRSGLVPRWRVALISVALVAALILGISRIPQVSAWGWRVLFASRNLRVEWQPDADLDSISGVSFGVLVADPSSSRWTLLATSVDLRNGVDSVVALQYKDVTGAVFTLSETPAAGKYGVINYDPQDPNQFLLKVGRSNVAFHLPTAGLVSASWITNGIQVEIWGSGRIDALLRLIESLIPYPPLSERVQISP